MRTVRHEVKEIRPIRLNAAEAFYNRALAALRTMQTKITDRPYRGYSNYSTCCICTTILNNPDLYARLITRLERLETITPLNARLIGGVLLARRLPDTEAEWNRIDWKQVALIWDETLAEHRSCI